MNKLDLLAFMATLALLTACGGGVSDLVSLASNASSLT